MVLLWYTWFFMTSVCVKISAYRIQPLDKQNEAFFGLDIDVLNGSEDLFDSRTKEILASFATTKAPGTNRQMFLFFIPKDNSNGAQSESTPLDSWSVVWYVACFGGLIVFFLIVSCSEWCCRRAIRHSRNCARSAQASPVSSVPDTPPPSYDQFAPPSYESICLGRSQRRGEKSEYDIYVVPVHTLGTLLETRRNEDAPPSYVTASRTFNPAVVTT